MLDFPRHKKSWFLFDSLYSKNYVTSWYRIHCTTPDKTGGGYIGNKVPQLHKAWMLPNELDVAFNFCGYYLLLTYCCHSRV